MPLQALHVAYELWAQNHMVSLTTTYTKLQKEANSYNEQHAIIHSNSMRAVLLIAPDPPKNNLTNHCTRLLMRLFLSASYIPYMLYVGLL